MIEIAPMLAKLADTLPPAGGYLFEPKWDGFRAIVTNDYIQSRDLKPLDRYFPELHDAFAAQLPDGVILDGEIVIVTPDGLSFDLLQMRLHPAASRVAKLAAATPASFVAFDLLNNLSLPQHERRRNLERLFTVLKPPLYLTPMTRDRAIAERWLAEFEGAGLDGVMAKPENAPYQPGKRAMIKIKHARTADCVVAGFRWYKNDPDAVGSLILGLYDDAGNLHHVGVTSSFTMDKRKALVAELAPLRTGTREGGPPNRWNAGKDQSWEPLRLGRVCEVKYDHLQGDRFRHTTTFQRWRPDKAPEDCRYDQLEVVAPYELSRVFSAGTVEPA